MKSLCLTRECVPGLNGKSVIAAGSDGGDGGAGKLPCGCDAGKSSDGQSPCGC